MLSGSFRAYLRWLVATRRLLQLWALCFVVLFLAAVSGVMMHGTWSQVLHLGRVLTATVRLSILALIVATIISLVFTYIGGAWRSGDR